MKERILNLINQFWKFDNNQQPQSSWHDKQYLLERVEKEFDLSKSSFQTLSEKYLKECDDRAHSADPLHADIVLNDLLTKINKLTNHIRELQTLYLEYQSK